MSFTDNFGNPKGFLGRLMLIAMDKEHLPMATWGFEQFEMPQEADIIDLGCGGGYNMKRIMERCPKGKVFGFDISEESVKKAKAVNKAQLGKRCRIMQGSVEKIPVDDQAFDLATAFETVFFWPAPAENFKEVFRIIKKGGRFVVINNYGNPNIDWEKKVPCMTRYTAEQIKGFMEGAGFVDVKVSNKDLFFCVVGNKK